MPERAQGQSCLCGWAGIKAKIEIYAVQVVVDIDAYIESIEGGEGERKRGREREYREIWHMHCCLLSNSLTITFDIC